MEDEWFSEKYFKKVWGMVDQLVHDEDKFFERINREI